MSGATRSEYSSAGPTVSRRKRPTRSSPANSALIRAPASGMDGDTVEVAASGPVRLVFGHADPIDEPVVAHGPFVMTTREEIGEAIRDYQAGLFGPVPVIA